MHLKKLHDLDKIYKWHISVSNYVTSHNNAKSKDAELSL